MTAALPTSTWETMLDDARRVGRCSVGDVAGFNGLKLVAASVRSGRVDKIDGFSSNRVPTSIDGRAATGLCESLRRCSTMAPASPPASHQPQPGSGEPLGATAVAIEPADGFVASSLAGRTGRGAMAGKASGLSVGLAGAGGGAAVRAEAAVAALGGDGAGDTMACNADAVARFKRPVCSSP